MRAMWIAVALPLALLATSAHAGEDGGNGGTTMPASRVAVDSKTGRLRAPTADENAALDRAEQAQAAAAGRSRAAVRGHGRPVFPQTEAESTRTARVVHGITIMKPAASLLSSLHVVRDADGNIVISHQDGNDDHPVEAQGGAAHE